MHTVSVHYEFWFIIESLFNLTFQSKTVLNVELDKNNSKMVFWFKKFHSKMLFRECHQTEKKSKICKLFSENCSLIEILLKSIDHLSTAERGAGPHREDGENSLNNFLVIKY